MERQQFSVLFHAFRSRIVDAELVSPGGDVQNLFVQAAAILIAFNFVVTYGFVPRYFTSTLPRATLQIRAWGDEEFVISSTISVVALLIVLAWNSFLPDIRDALVLGGLPVRRRTVGFAKLSAIGCAVLCVVLLGNIFTSFGYASIAAADSSILSFVRALGSYWIACLAAALFTVSFFCLLQALAVQLLSYRAFLRFSSWLQMISFFSILALFLLKPPLATVEGLTVQNWHCLRLLPSYWFLGFFQELNGSDRPIFARLAGYGMMVTFIVLIVSAVSLARAYRNIAKKIVEQPDISPADRSTHVSQALTVVLRALLPRPIDRAIFSFSLCTIARSHKHRLLMAMYSGIGLAIGIAYTESLLRGGWGHQWSRPNEPLLVASLIVLFFVVLGMRLVFTFPQALRCNWVFRVTAVNYPADYFLAVRKSLYGMAMLPVLIACTILFCAIWPLPSALLHIGVLALVGAIVVEKSLCGFRKIPFACSYLPGKSNLNVTLGLYAAGILVAASRGAALELWAMGQPYRYLGIVSLLLGFMVWRRHQFNRFAAAPMTTLQFEERPADHIVSMDLRKDGELA